MPRWSLPGKTPAEQAPLYVAAQAGIFASESRVISPMRLAPVSVIATRISLSISPSRCSTPAWPAAASA